MKLLVMINNTPILNFDLDLKKKIISNVEVHRESFVKTVFNIDDCNPLTYDSFYNDIKMYMGSSFELSEYIDWIEKKGFYTPYHSSLKIKIINNTN